MQYFGNDIFKLTEKIRTSPTEKIFNVQGWEEEEWLKEYKGGRGII